MIWYNWVFLALLLVAQNFAFTYVSRARNSGSLSRHLKAAVFSNGIWFTNSILLFSVFFDIVRGHRGLLAAIFAGIFYTTFTILGSITAHYWSLRTEKGKEAVGANKKYAQIPVQEWETVKGLVLPAISSAKY